MSSPFSSPKQDGSPDRTHNSGTTEHSSPPVAVPGQLKRPSDIPQYGHHEPSGEHHEATWPETGDQLLTDSPSMPSKVPLSRTILCEHLLPHIQTCKACQIQIASTFQSKPNNTPLVISKAEAESICDSNQHSLQATAAIENLVFGRGDSVAQVSQTAGHSRVGLGPGSSEDALEVPRNNPSGRLRLQEALSMRDCMSDSYRSFNTIEQSEAAANASNEQLLDIIGALREGIETTEAESRQYYEWGDLLEAEEARKKCEQFQMYYNRFERHGADVLQSVEVIKALLRYQEKRACRLGGKRQCEGVGAGLLESTQAAKRARPR